MIQYIVENWETLLALVAAIHALALVIVNLTPTPKDDVILAKIYKVVQILAGVISSVAKGEADKDKPENKDTDTETTPDPK